jgi:chorismate-pyruvate lyase
MDQVDDASAVVKRSSTIPQPILGTHYTMPGLSDVERLLLVSDGTFTYQLETLVRQPVGVEILSNQIAPLSPSDAQLLDCGEGTLVWARETLLRGGKSKAAYAYATSLINDKGLDHAVGNRPSYGQVPNGSISGVADVPFRYWAGLRRLLSS